VPEDELDEVEELLDELELLVDGEPDVHKTYLVVQPEPPGIQQLTISLLQ